MGEFQLFQMGMGIAGHVAINGIPAVVADAHKDQRFDLASDRHKGLRTRSVLCVPVRHAGGVVAVVELRNKASLGVFTQADQEHLESLTQVAPAVYAVTHRCSCCC